MSPHLLQSAADPSGPSAPLDSTGNTHSADDVAWMRLALAQAEQAGAAGEVPVGAVVVKDGQLVAVGRNAPVAQHDPCAHAEVQALRAAGQALGNYRLGGCTLYVTLEPCAMCSGALLHARVQRVVFGATDPKTGAAGSVLNLFAMAQLNPRTTVQGGVLAAECAGVLRQFFAPRRSNPHPLREDALRTPEACFANLTDWPWPIQTHHSLPALHGLQLAWVDTAAPATGQVRPLTPGTQPQPTLVCLPPDGTWGYALRHVVAAAVAQGWRVCVPDLMGFGRSDKPKKAHWHTVAQHAQVLAAWANHIGIDHAVWLLPPAGVTARIAAELLGQHPPWACATVPMAHAAAPATPAHPAQAEVFDTELPALQAPYPDAGYLAGPKAFQALATPAPGRGRGARAPVLGNRPPPAAAPFCLDEPSHCAALVHSLPQHLSPLRCVPHARELPTTCLHAPHE